MPYKSLLIALSAITLLASCVPEAGGNKKSKKDEDKSVSKQGKSQSDLQINGVELDLNGFSAYQNRVQGDVVSVSTQRGTEVSVTQDHVSITDGTTHAQVGQETLNCPDGKVLVNNSVCVTQGQAGQSVNVDNFQVAGLDTPTAVPTAQADPVGRKRHSAHMGSYAGAPSVVGDVNSFDGDIDQGKLRITMVKDSITTTASGPTIYLGRMRRTATLRIYNGDSHTKVCLQLIGWDNGRCNNQANWGVTNRYQLIPHEDITSHMREKVGQWGNKITVDDNDFSWKLFQDKETGVKNIYKNFRLDYFEGREVELFFKNSDSQTSVRFFVESKANSTWVMGNDFLASMTEAERRAAYEAIIVEHNYAGNQSLTSHSIYARDYNTISKTKAIIYHCGEGCEICGKSMNECTGPNKDQFFNPIHGPNSSLEYNPAVGQYSYEFKNLSRDFFKQFKGKTLHYYFRKNSSDKPVKGLSLTISPTFN